MKSDTLKKEANVNFYKVSIKFYKLCVTEIMIITRKIELVLKNKEDGVKLKKWYSLMPKLHNTIVTNIFLNDIIKEKMANYDVYFNEQVNSLDKKITAEYEKMRGCKDEEKRKKGMEVVEKLKKERNKINFEGKKQFDNQFKEVFGKQFDGFIYNIVRQDEALGEIPSNIAAASLQNLSFYKKSLNAIKSGEERIRMYGKGMPMPLPKTVFNIVYNKDSDIFELNMTGGIEFKLHLGRDKSNNRIILERIFDNIYGLADSQLQYLTNKKKKKKEWFLLMCVNVPENKNDLLENTIIGVDMGINIPAYCAVNNSLDRASLGKREDIINFRNGIRKQRRNMQKNLSVSGRGGQGYDRKMKALNSLADKERAFVKNYNHKISKEVVKFAVKNKAKYINLELLEGFGKDEDGKSIDEYKWLCSNWSYYELKTLIEYKAKLEGIEVRYIDPYHTSQTCSCCGHYEQGQRLTQEKFICANCGEEMNADYNASKNIAKSTKFVEKKKDCEYYKKNVDNDE